MFVVAPSPRRGIREGQNRVTVLHWREKGVALRKPDALAASHRSIH